MIDPVCSRLNVAPEKSATVTFAALSVAKARSAPVRSVFVRFAVASDAPLRSEPERLSSEGWHARGCRGRPIP